MSAVVPFTSDTASGTNSGTNAISYVQQLFEGSDWITLQFIHQTEKFTNGNGTQALTRNEFMRAVDFTSETVSHIRELQAGGFNSFVAMNAFTPGCYRRRKLDVAAVRNFYVDLDENAQIGLDKIMADVEAGIIPDPQFVLASSPEKRYVIWQVSGATIEVAEAINASLARRFGGDPASTDVARVLRLPGTLNLKPAYHPTPVVTVLRHSAHERYTPADFHVEFTVKTRVDHSADPAAQTARAEFYEKACENAGIDMGEFSEKDGAYRYEVDCPNAEQHTDGNEGGASVMIYPSGRVSFGCFHAHCREFGWMNFYRPWMEIRARENGFKAFLKFGDSSEVPQQGRGPYKSGKPANSREPKSQQPQYAMSPEEFEAEMDKEYPVVPLVEQAGPSWSDDIMFGVAGDIIRKACQYNESHPAGMYLDLLVSFGSMIGRTAYFRINSTHHYTNEFLARVGATSKGRKGSGRDVVDELNKLVDSVWCDRRTLSGFGSGESIVNELRDSSQQQMRNKKDQTFKTIDVPGVDDKRLCVREGELASIFQLASKSESRASLILRDGWDGKSLWNTVKGKSDGLSNSARCLEPHLSISGDTTVSELLRTMPTGSDENGFGNRFLFCYVYRTKMCSQGGPPIDWSEDVARLREAIEFAMPLNNVPLSASAKHAWNRIYLKLSDDQLPGLAGAMTAREAAHIRRLSLILALLDLSDVVDTKHLQAALKIWNYCRDSAQYIFQGVTKEQLRIVNFIEKNGSTSLTQISEDVFKQHKKIGWIRTQIDDCKSLAREDEVVSISKEYSGGVK